MVEMISIEGSATEIVNLPHHLDKKNFQIISKAPSIEIMRLGTFLSLFWLIFILKNQEIEAQKYSVCVSGRHIKRLQLNAELFSDCQAMPVNSTLIRRPRRVDPTFRGNPKPRAELLANQFNVNAYNFEQTNSLVNLINKIAVEYLSKCPPVIYYDHFVKKSDGLILENLFKTFPITFYHGEINANYVATNTHFKERIDEHCKSFILFLSDPLMTRKIIGPQISSRVVLIARSTQWKLRDFLASEMSSNIVNLLVIGESLTADPTQAKPFFFVYQEHPYVLYTHKLYSDGLGSNTPVVLTSWIRGALTRPHINLFPSKFEAGFSGHRFVVSAVNQPPFAFVLRKLGQGGSTNVYWDGIEYRLLNMIALKLNFSIDLSEPPLRTDTRGNIEAIQWQVTNKHADIGMSGIYVTEDRMKDTDMSVGHSMDCAAFITLASKALPKYRAIMGPFQWPVWLALTFIYLGAIFPIVYTDRLSLTHLIGNWSEIENMFWYVFGMFTNSLTFSGKYSWSNSKKASTRILIGSYWFFTIIITACYTGSIIAFVTLPAFPETIDSVHDLLGLFFRVGTLDRGGWENWFQNSTHEPTAKLYKKMEFVASLEEGIGNVTQSFFWNYAFLGSKAQLEYLVQANFSDESISKRSALHLSEECFALFQVGFIFPRDAVYNKKISSMILLAHQSGLINKIEGEVRWVMQRSSSGKLLQAGAGGALRERIQEERQLTTADTEGMFLLMGIGYALGTIALISEIVGGITNKCRQILKRKRPSFSTNFSSERSSASDGGEKAERTNVELKAHLRRKADRRKAAEDAYDEQNNTDTRLGFKQFNLTKATLKELYTNYNKQKPNYVLKDGKLILENMYMATDTASGESRVSSGDLPMPALKVKTEAIVLAEIDKMNKVAVEDLMDADIEATLTMLDKNICAYEEHDDASEDEVFIAAFPYQNEELFGSVVEMRNDDTKKFDNLKLLNPFDEHYKPE